MRKLSILLLLILTGAVWLAGILPNTEFVVNTYTIGNQTQPCLGTNGEGKFVVAWTSEVVWDTVNGRELSEIFAQVLDSSGNPVGPEILVNTQWEHFQDSPAIAVGKNGNFVITWVHFLTSTDSAEIKARVYDKNGLPLGGEFQVNEYTTGFQGNPDIAMDGEGNFVITWESWAQDTSGLGIYAKKFDPVGNPLTSEFQVNTHSLDDQFHPAIAINSTNQFIIVWTSYAQDGFQTGLFAQRFETNGNKIVSEFRVNFSTEGWQDGADVAIDSSDNYIFCWHSHRYDASAYDIFARFMDSTTAIVGPEFRVNSTTDDWQVYPKIDTDENGNFTIIWQSHEQGGDVSAILAKMYDRNGNIVEPEFLVSDAVLGKQEAPEMKMISRQKFISVWQSFPPSGTGYDIIAKIIETETSISQSKFEVPPKKRHVWHK